MDQMRPCFHYFIASKILRISRTNAMGSSAPRDGIFGGRPQLQADVPQGVTSGLDGFADSDWGIAPPVDPPPDLWPHSTKLVLWWSKTKKTISLSTAEAEYYAASEMAIKVIYLRNLLENMGFHPCTRTTPRGQRVHRMGQPRHRGTWTCQAHWSPQAFCAWNHPKSDDTPDQNRHLQATSRHLHQAIGVRAIYRLCPRNSRGSRRHASDKGARSEGQTLRRALRLLKGDPFSSELMMESRLSFGGVFARKSMQGPRRHHLESEHPSQWQCDTAGKLSPPQGTRKSRCYVAVIYAVEPMWCETVRLPCPIYLGLRRIEIYFRWEFLWDAEHEWRCVRAGCVPARDAEGRTSFYAEKTAQSLYAQLGCRQAMASSHIVPRQLDEEITRDNDACQEFENQGQLSKYLSGTRTCSGSRRKQ